MTHREILISIHSPYEGRDEQEPSLSVSIFLFQSTLPMKGETLSVPSAPTIYGVISIHSPYEGRDPYKRWLVLIESISIHSPYEGRDVYLAILDIAKRHFNPLSL